MTRDERIAEIRRASSTAGFSRADWDDVRFLLAELDAAEARVQRLTDALERTPCDIYAHADCRAQSPAIIEKVGLCPRCAALAEGEAVGGKDSLSTGGEDTRG